MTSCTRTKTTHQQAGTSTGIHWAPALPTSSGTLGLCTQIPRNSAPPASEQALDPGLLRPQTHSPADQHQLWNSLESTASHVRNWTCPPAGQHEILDPQIHIHPLQNLSPPTSGWQPLHKAGPDNQPDQGPATPTKLPHNYPPQQKGPHSPNRGQP